MELDVNDMRNMESELQGIPVCDDVMTFYYDETGNCRKFALTEMGINAPDALINDFILGGIVFDGHKCPVDVDALFSALKLQPTVKELKFKHIYGASKDFLQCLNGRKISAFLSWLSESKLHIHFTTLNNLYYSVVDIVDSLWEAQPQFCFLMDWVNGLKSALYRFAAKHSDQFLGLITLYHYPDVARQDIQNFCDDLCNFISIECDEDFLLESFRQMLKYAGKHGELPFLHDNEPGHLIDEYYTLYLSRCYTYKNAMHYFDEELEVQTKMDQCILMDGKQKIQNYAFLKSTGNKLIQVSDVVVGILAKLFHFLDSQSVDGVQALSRKITSGQRLNLKRIYELLTSAEKRNIMLIRNINDVSLVQARVFKLQILKQGGETR